MDDVEIGQEVTEQARAVEARNEVQVVLSLTPDELRQIESWCDMLGLTVSEQARKLLLESSARYAIQLQVPGYLTWTTAPVPNGIIVRPVEHPAEAVR